MCNGRWDGSPSAWLLEHLSFLDFSLYSSLDCPLRLLTSGYDHVTHSLYLLIQVRNNLIHPTAGQPHVGKNSHHALVELPFEQGLRCTPPLGFLEKYFELSGKIEF